MTTGISLVRENTESMRPPRALWVPFPLGRPLGKADDPRFQHQVINHALGLLNRSEGPVLDDFPLDLPNTDQEAIEACPVSFPVKPQGKDTWANRLLAEFKLLQPWYQLSIRRKNGRTLVGIAPHSCEENLKRLAELMDADNFPQDVDWLKPATDDLKAFYIESMTAQPGSYDQTEVSDQFWQHTELGAALILIYEHFQESELAHQRILARMLAPREAVSRASIIRGGDRA